MKIYYNVLSKFQSSSSSRSEPSNEYMFTSSFLKTCCFVKISPSRSSTSSFSKSSSLCTDQLETSTPPPPQPPRKPRAFQLLKIGLFKFLPPRAKKVFKCPILSSDLSVCTQLLKTLFVSQLLIYAISLSLNSSI